MPQDPPSERALRALLCGTCIPALKSDGYGPAPPDQPRVASYGPVSSIQTVLGWVQAQMDWSLIRFRLTRQPAGDKVPVQVSEEHPSQSSLPEIIFWPAGHGTHFEAATRLLLSGSRSDGHLLSAGISVQRNTFDPTFWAATLAKLTTFYNTALVSKLVERL